MKGLSRMCDFAAANIVGGQVATDRPPSDPTRRLFGLHGPDCDIWMNVKGRVIANSEVIDPLTLEVFLHHAPLRLNPPIFTGGMFRHRNARYGPNGQDEP